MYSQNQPFDSNQAPKSVEHRINMFKTKYTSNGKPAPIPSPFLEAHTKSQRRLIQQQQSMSISLPNATNIVLPSQSGADVAIIAETPPSDQTLAIRTNPYRKDTKTNSVKLYIWNMYALQYIDLDPNTNNY